MPKKAPKKSTKKKRGAKVLLQQQVAACIFLSRMPARTQKKALDAGHHSVPGGNSWKIRDFSKNVEEIVSMKKMRILMGIKYFPVIQILLLVYLGGHSCLAFVMGVIQKFGNSSPTTK